MDERTCSLLTFFFLSILFLMILRNALPMRLREHMESPKVTPKKKKKAPRMIKREEMNQERPVPPKMPPRMVSHSRKPEPPQQPFPQRTQETQQQPMMPQQTQRMPQQPMIPQQTQRMPQQTQENLKTQQVPPNPPYTPPPNSVCVGYAEALGLKSNKNTLESFSTSHLPSMPTKEFHSAYEQFGEGFNFGAPYP